MDKKWGSSSATPFTSFIAEFCEEYCIGGGHCCSMHPSGITPPRTDLWTRVYYPPPPLSFDKALLLSEKTYPTLGKGNNLQKCRLEGDMLLRWSSHLASGKPLGHLEGEQPGTGLTNHGYLGSGFMVFVVHPCLGKIPIFTSIFQTGWFNHQLSIVINHETSKSWEPILLT